MDTPRFHVLSHLALISFSGEDAQSFLQGQLTCNLNALPPTASTYGSYCTPKGRMLATFLLWRSSQSIFMQLPAALREPVQKRLSMFVLRSKVHAHDASEEFARFGLSGAGSDELAARACGDVPLAAHEVKHTAHGTLIRLSLDRLQVVVPADRADTVRDQLLQGAAETAAGEWDWLDIHAGIPMVTSRTREELVPQMANLDLIGGVSLNKGCYPGQEIVARMHYLGRLKQRTYLAHVESDAPPQPGDPVYSADFGRQASGMIVNAAPAPDGGHDVLASIQIQSMKSGSVHWNAPDGPQLEFLPLPYEVRA